MQFLTMTVFCNMACHGERSQTIDNNTLFDSVYPERSRRAQGDSMQQIAHKYWVLTFATALKTVRANGRSPLQAECIQPEYHF